MEEFINDKSGEIEFFGKLNVFENSNNKLEKISQEKISSLFDLLKVAMNQHLQFQPRISALEQINEIFFFYRNSAALGDFAGCMMTVCIENIEEFAKKRENFSLNF